MQQLSFLKSTSSFHLYHLYTRTCVKNKLMFSNLRGTETSSQERHWVFVVELLITQDRILGSCSECPEVRLTYSLSQKYTLWANTDGKILLFYLFIRQISPMGLVSCYQTLLLILKEISCCLLFFVLLSDFYRKTLWVCCAVELLRLFVLWTFCSKVKP